MYVRKVEVAKDLNLFSGIFLRKESGRILDSE
jgi:hypothetical protein